jgi:hypothetical protein
LKARPDGRARAGEPCLRLQIRYGSSSSFSNTDFQSRAHTRCGRQKLPLMQTSEEEVIELEDAGHSVERFTDFRWRIDGVDV